MIVSDFMLYYTNQTIKGKCNFLYTMFCNRTINLVYKSETHSIFFLKPSYHFILLGKMHLKRLYFLICDYLIHDCSGFLNKVKIKRDEYFMKSCDGTNMVALKLLSILQFISHHNHVSLYIQNDHV